MSFPRSWYQPLALSTGLAITVASFIIGWLRWPTRPHYTFLGILVGMWVLYPYLLPGSASDSHPLGYVLVLGTPLLVGYVIWKDAGNLLLFTSSLIYPIETARQFDSGTPIVSVN